MSGRLFDAPFRSNNQSAYYGTHQESTPLRRRENDSFASPQYRKTAAELPFQSYNRRKRAASDRWIKYTMRAVLLSPVVVLVIWSLVAVTFTHKQVTNASSQKRQSSRKQHVDSSSRRAKIVNDAEEAFLNGIEVVETALGATPHNKRQQQGGGQHHNFFPLIAGSRPRGATGSGQRLIVQPENLRGIAQNDVSQGYDFPKESSGQYYNFPKEGSGVYYDFPKEGSVALQQVPQEGSGVYYDFPKEGQYDSQYLIPKQGSGAYYNFPKEGHDRYHSQYLIPKQGSEAYYDFPKEGHDRYHSQYLIPKQGSGAYYDFPKEGSQLSADDERMKAEQPVMGMAASRGHHHSNLRHDRHRRADVHYYYYDPRATVRDENGLLYLPTTVYDSKGRAVPLQALSDAAEEVYFEPPPAGMIHHNISANATYINVTHSHPNVVETPVKDRKKGLSMPEMKSDQWGESNASGSSIIVCTVGVMALLVGAISAKRMRGRSVLSACIENEALEDDIAYDTAYTISGGSGNQYNTFSQGWKGDLEKFDV